MKEIINNMKIALVCIAKNEDNYIQEWIDYNFKLGFDKIFIYINNWKYNNDNENIEIIQFDGNSRQLPAYNHFIKNNYNIYDYAAFIDIDEFIVLHKHSNIKSFLADYNDYDGVGINWYLFGDNSLKEVKDNDYSLLKRFTKRENKVNQHIKSILKLDMNTFMITPHSSNKTIVDPHKNFINGPYNKLSDNSIAQINHYFCKTYPEFIEKVERGRSDINVKRKMSDFEEHNKNEIEDLSAYNFYYGK